MPENRIRFRGNYLYFLYVILFTFFSLCPFLFPLMDSDVQPYAFLLSLPLVFVSLFNLAKNRVITIVLLSAVIAILLFIIEPGQFAFRLLYGYVSFFFVLVASYYSASKYGVYLEAIIKAIIIIWFFVGLFQLFGGNKRLLAFLVSNARTSSDRGVFGLASEPSFFGVQCFYFLFLVSLFKRHKLLFMGLCAIMSVFMAQSTLGVIFLVVYLLLYAFDTKKVKYIIPCILAISAIAVYIVLNDSGGRLTYLVGEFFSNNMTSFEEDQSTSVRLNSIFYSWNSVFENYFLPQGFIDRYGCLIGDTLVVFGFWGIPLVFIILSGLSKSFHHKDIVVVSFVLFAFLFNSNIQISNPSLAFVLGFLLNDQDRVV